MHASFTMIRRFVYHHHRQRSQRQLFNINGVTFWSQPHTQGPVTLHNNNMKLSFASLAVLSLASSSSAWAPVAVGSARRFAAAALFSVSTEQAGETGTFDFRLKFKDEVSSFSYYVHSYL